MAALVQHRELEQFALRVCAQKADRLFEDQERFVFAGGGAIADDFVEALREVDALQRLGYLLQLVHLQVAFLFVDGKESLHHEGHVHFHQVVAGLQEQGVDRLCVLQPRLALLMNGFREPREKQDYRGAARVAHQHLHRVFPELAVVPQRDRLEEFEEVAREGRALVFLEVARVREKALLDVFGPPHEGENLIFGAAHATHALRVGHVWSAHRGWSACASRPCCRCAGDGCPRKRLRRG